MRAGRSAVAHRSLAGFGVLLGTAVFAAPALAQIETVIVTAEKKSEDIQSTPVAVTALTSEDLAAQQIDSYRDLQFAVPNVTYNKSEYLGASFQIRGVGNLTVSSSADTGIAQHIDDVYIETNDLSTGQYYDLDRIEVLRGPQGTLYGREAAGGAVNVITAKPDLDAYSGHAEASAGTYGTAKGTGAVNIPLLPGELGLRLAGDYNYHNGFTHNLGTGDNIDGQNEYSVRGSLRWQPTSRTTVDFIATYQKEDDSHTRGDKQLCHADPAGVMGCLPDRLGDDAAPPMTNFASVLGSRQFLDTLLDTVAYSELQAGALTQAQFAAVTGPGGPMQSIADGLGMFDLTRGAAQEPDAVPADPRTVNTDYDPRFNQNTAFYTLQWQQTLAPWLKMTAVGGYLAANDVSTESFLMSPDVSLANAGGTVARSVTQVQSYFNTLATAPASGFPCTNLSASYQCALEFLSPTGATTFNPAAYGTIMAAMPGKLPLSSTKLDGVVSATQPASPGIETYSDAITGHDTYTAKFHQWTGELRFASDFSGPLNFLLGGFYLHYRDEQVNYYVNLDTFDYDATVLGSLEGNLGLPPLTGPVNGLLATTPFYYNSIAYDEIETKAIFGEAYYTLLPDRLKLTLGARYTDDRKSSFGYNGAVGSLAPIGTTDPTTNLAPQLTKVENSKLTGRAVLDWTPQLDFTDRTLVYLSAARGFKSGGANPPVSMGFPVPATFLPETLDALELGTKNTLLGGLLQANVTAWYYDYKNLQTTIIVARTSVNTNIPAHLMGLEGEFVYAPDDHWQINVNLTESQSAIGNASEVDPRNPGAGAANAVVVKDISNGSLCVINMPTANSLTPAELGVPGFFAPPQANGEAATTAAEMRAAVSQDASSGVAYVNWGKCPTFEVGGASDAQLPPGYHYAGTGPDANGQFGNPVSLKGNDLPELPRATISVGVQYRFDLMGGYSLVPRVDYYYQSAIWTRIFNAPADRIGAWDVMNAQLQLNAPDSAWYARLYVTNLFDKANPTGAYLQDQSAGGYTNLFLEDPRVIGVTLGTSW